MTDTLEIPTGRLLFGRSHPGCPGVIRAAVRVGTKQTPHGARPNMVPGLYFCTHPSHEDQSFDTCLECGERGVELDPFFGCTDVDGCQERQADRRRQNPLWQMLQESKAVGDAVRAEKAAERTAKRGDDATPRAPREADPLGGRCNHCGEATKGGRFLAGHDAKLKGELMRQAQEDDTNAMLELLVRNWMKRPQVLDQNKLELARNALQGMNGTAEVEFLQKRNEGRWAK